MPKALDSFTYEYPLQCQWCRYWREEDPSFGQCVLDGVYREAEEWCKQCKISLAKKTKHK